MSDTQANADTTDAQLPDDASPPAEQTGTEFRDAILYVMADLDEEPYGLAIKRGLEDYYGEDVNHGRLYPNLDSLIEHGYVEKEHLDKRTNGYTLTEKGREYLLQDIAWKASQIGLAVEEAENQEWSA